MNQLTKSVLYTFSICQQILEAKNKDYATDQDPFKNFIATANLANISVSHGILIHIGDKLSRISNLLNKDMPVVYCESLEDTIQDVINYLAILKAWLEYDMIDKDPALIKDTDKCPHCGKP